MNHVVRSALATVWIACGVGVLPLLAQSPSDLAVRVNAEVQTEPPSITLSWLPDSRIARNEVYRKLRDDTDWGSPSTLAGDAVSFVDTNVAVGGTYEYRIKKWTDLALGGEGCIYAGIQAPLVESRGKVVLVVDNSFTASLSNELTRLQQDLVGDGWIVLRRDVPRMAVDPANMSSSVWVVRSNELACVKELIKADYNADPANVRAVFLIGHVPVPYSGDLKPDHHNEHQGAWPADGFYADMDGSWPDSTVNRTTASDPRNRNVPGDGKFDRTVWPLSGGRFQVELQLGRVDLSNLPAFASSETELLRRYLDKDHNFRHKLISAERRGLIDDGLGYLNGEAPAVNGWRDFAPFFGASNSISDDWLTTLSTQGYLWGYGCGGGTYTSCSGVATTSQLATSDPRVVFTMFFGSYFGDWDSPNNLLRAALATTNYTLTGAWVARPHWHFHHMGLGETIGFSTRLTQNNDGLLYPANGYQYFVHIALMGDPTLRMHVVGPPSDLAATNDPGGVLLTWHPSTDDVLGYHVYRAPTAAGPFTRLNSTLLASTNYVDPDVGTNVYMVRAVKLEVSGSGSYYNASQGIFQSFAGSSLPILTITAQDTNKGCGAPLPEFTVLYSGFVGDDGPEDLVTLPVLSTPATNTSPPGNYPIHASGATATNYIVRFVDGTLTILPAATTGLLSSSANPSLPGQEVAFTLTVNVVAPGAGTPTGAVQFNINGTNAGAPVSLDGGAASYTNSALEHGWHQVEAVYAGDGCFNGASAFLSPDQLVNTPPVAAADSLERDPTNAATAPISALLTNDWDADGDPLSLDGVSGTSAQGGSVVVNGDWVSYTPAPGFASTDTFTYAISDGYAGPVSGTVTVNVRLDYGPPPRLGISPLENGAYALTGEGVPNRTYRVESAEDLGEMTWQTLGVATADWSGSFRFTNAPVSAQRFYRSVYP